MSDGPRAVFEAGLAQGRILLPYCRRCDAYAYPPGGPARDCPHDPSLYESRPATGGGAVFAATCARRKPEKGGDAAVLLVDLDEGVRVMAAGVGEPPAVGARVRVTVATEGENAPRLQAQPAPEGA